MLKTKKNPYRRRNVHYEDADFTFLDRPPPPPDSAGVTAEKLRRRRQAGSCQMLAAGTAGWTVLSGCHTVLTVICTGSKEPVAPVNSLESLRDKPSPLMYLLGTQRAGLGSGRGSWVCGRTTRARRPPPGHAGTLGEALRLDFSFVIWDGRGALPLLPPTSEGARGDEALRCPRKPDSASRAS